MLPKKVFNLLKSIAYVMPLARDVLRERDNLRKEVERLSLETIYLTEQAEAVINSEKRTSEPPVESRFFWCKDESNDR